MVGAHAQRDHAVWSASATERLWACPGSLALTIDLPESTSEAADWGTCAHQIAEKCLRGNGPAARYIGTTEKGKSYSFEVDEEMAETAQTYVDYVVSVLDAEDEGVKFWIEQHFTLASLNPPFDAGGTADAVVYLPRAKTLEVIDLKGGRGHVVEAIGNPQGRTYALGAMLAHQGLDVDRVKVTIVQPRAPHKDGRIRSDEFHVAELIEWTADLVQAMKHTHEAMLLYPPNFVHGDAHYAVHGLKGRQNISQPEWDAAYLKAGDHCKFCKAKSFCPAIEAKAVATVGAWFEPSGEPRLPEVRPGDDPVTRRQKLDLLEMIEGWIAAYREDEHRRAEAGDPADGYVLVPKQGREKWNDGAEAEVINLATTAGLKPETFQNEPKLRTPKQVRAAADKAGKKDLIVALAALSSTPDAGTNLVRADKTTRQPVGSTAQRFFEPSTN